MSNGAEAELPPAALLWAGEQLNVRSCSPVRVRPWSAVGRLDTDEGVWWLKINFAGTTYEPGLLQCLAQLDPGLLPSCRTHHTQPWALIADAGRSARVVLADASQDQQVEFWCGLLARYAELQQAWTASALTANAWTANEETRHGGTSLQVPDFSPDRLLSRFDEALGEARWFGLDAAPELTAGELARIRACRPALIRAAALLGQGLPSAIQHDDLHDDNVLLDPGKGQHDDVRIIDWGDAVVAHPFGTLLVTRGALAEQWQVPADDKSIVWVQDAYLEPWRTAGESAAELADQVDLAVRTGALSRACAWMRALGHPDAGRELDFNDAASGWLLRLADALEPTVSLTT